MEPTDTIVTDTINSFNKDTKIWYFYVVISVLSDSDDICFYIGISKNLKKREYDHRYGSDGCVFLKEHCNMDKLFIFVPIPFVFQTSVPSFAQDFETALACIFKDTYYSKKVIGGHYNQNRCEITDEKISVKIREFYNQDYKNNEMNEIYIKKFNLFEFFLEKVCEKDINFVTYINLEKYSDIFGNYSYYKNGQYYYKIHLNRPQIKNTSYQNPVVYDTLMKGSIQSGL